MKKKLLLVALCISLVLSMAAFAQASGSDKKSDNAGKQEGQTEQTQVADEEVTDWSKLAESYFVTEEEALKAYGLDRRECPSSHLLGPTICT